MHEQLQQRLATLQKEWGAGQARLKDLEQEQVRLSQTMFRISGAIQVLEEILADNQSAEEVQQKEQ